MARKKDQDATEAQSCANDGKMIVDAKHGHFASHPMFDVLMTADALRILPNEALLADAGWKLILDETIGKLGQWLFNVSGQRPADVRGDLIHLASFIEYLAEKKFAEAFKEKVIRVHLFLRDELKRFPTLTELKVKVAGDGSDDDNRTLRRILEDKGLPICNQKTIDRIKAISESLSKRGAVDVARLRKKLMSPVSVNRPPLPEGDDELIAFCVACGAQLNMRQVITAFLSCCLAGVAPTDLNLWRSFPKWTLKHYWNDNPENLRSDVKKMGLKLEPNPDPDWKWPLTRPPKREIGNSGHQSL